MTSPASPAGSKRNLKLWWAAAVIVLLTGTGFLVVGLIGHRDLPASATTAAPHLASPSSVAPAPSSPAIEPSATRTTKPTARPSARRSAARPARVPGAVARSTPVSLRIPAIGVSISLSSLGLNANGTVQVPGKDQQPGWYRLGPAPGQMGSAVILGHVDDYRGPAAFYKLRSLRAGDKVDVGLAGGAVAHFSVTSVGSYLKTQFPSRQVYASHGFPALQLVTCGGQFDSGTGHYLSNVVAYTSLVSTTPAGG
jgi:uncharacterized iron-regulated membrane protein